VFSSIDYTAGEAHVVGYDAKGALIVAMGSIMPEANCSPTTPRAYCDARH
jgi:hypothetical protein